MAKVLDNALKAVLRDHDGVSDDRISLRGTQVMGKALS